jgi:hypothetical protein
MKKKATDDFSFPFIPLIGARSGIFRQLHQQFTCHPDYQTRYWLSRIVSCILEPFRITEKWCTQKRIESSKPITDPVFIIGHWRSGTTLLHNLMSTDKQFGYCSTYQSLLPDLTLIHQRWLAPIINLLMPKHRPADHVALNLNYPQEEEFALGNQLAWCFYYAWYYPQEFSRLLDLHSTGKADPGLIQDWQDNYRKFISTALLNTGGQIYLSKNPPHTFRLDWLTRMFPNAKFIFIIRNPYEVFDSSVRFAQGVLPTTQAQPYTDDCLKDGIMQLMVHVFNRYERTKHLIRSANLIEIKYESLIADPAATLSSIYQSLDLGDPRKRVQELGATVKKSTVTPFRYSFSEDTINRVNASWHPLYNRFGYQKRGIINPV